MKIFPALVIVRGAEIRIPFSITSFLAWNFSMYHLIIAVIFLIIGKDAFAQQTGYIDHRPQAILRMDASDQGIVLRYGGGKDSCDSYGARDIIVTYDKGLYYMFYDGAGKSGWLACLAVSRDLRTWVKKGAILSLGDSTRGDYKSASAPWVIKENNTWHMFYLGTPHTTDPPDRIPAFPYLTLKARASSLEGPWIKQYEVTPLPIRQGTYYTVTASPGFVVKTEAEYMQFFSGSTQDERGTHRTLGIARTRDLNATWKIDSVPLFPLTEQVENSSLFYDKGSRYWFLFTNHIGIEPKTEVEYTDAVWVYWTRDINHWNPVHKAIVLDSTNCRWSRGAIGMPSVVQYGNRLAVLYDAFEGYSTGHMKRNIGLAWLLLPLKIPNQGN